MSHARGFGAALVLAVWLNLQIDINISDMYYPNCHVQGSQFDVLEVRERFRRSLSPAGGLERGWVQREKWGREMEGKVPRIGGDGPVGKAAAAQDP